MSGLQRVEQHLEVNTICRECSKWTRQVIRDGQAVSTWNAYSEVLESVNKALLDKELAFLRKGAVCRGCEQKERYA